MANTISTEKRAGDVQLGTKKGQLTINETYHYYVTTDNKWVDRRSVLLTPGLPIPSQTISPSGLGVCTSLTAERSEESSTRWEVSASFSSEVEDNSGNPEPGSNPETWVPVRETILEPYEEVLLVDKDDKRYVNGAGLPYSTGVTSPKDNIRWDFFQFEPITIKDEDIADRNNTINAGKYKTKDEHTLLLKVKSSAVGFYYGKRRRLTEYSLTWKEDNWHDKLANYGETFKHNDKVYAYRYEHDPDTVISGPLGSKHYKIGDDMDAAGGKPSGGVETVGGVVYALPPNKNTLWFIERRKFEYETFTNFLRI